jgi:hypothetical protein
MHDQVCVFGVVRSAFAKVQRPFARARGRRKKEGVVGAIRRMRIRFDRVCRNRARSRISERLQMPLRAIDVKVNVNVFEAIRSAIEQQR